MANSSLTISFSTSVTDANLYIDMDMDDDLNVGQTSFAFDSGTVYFRLFTNCSAVTFTASDGSTSPSSITGSGSENTNITEIITFAQDPNSTDDNTASLSYAATGSISAVLKSSIGCGTVSLDSNDSTNKTVIASQHGVGVYEVSYDADYHSISIEAPSMPSGWDVEESYPVVIVAVGS